MIAVNLIRPLPHYRRDAFDRGLRAAGYSLVLNGKPTGPEDLLVVWNRYGAFHERARNWEAAGGTVLVCENGYIGADVKGHQLYAISAEGHNGSGWWPIGTEDRFSALGIEVKPWVSRPDGYALICGQRGIGSPTMASPPNWHVGAERRVRAWWPRTKVRLHPGNNAPAVPLSADLAGASHCVIWSSSSGVKALCEGIHVAYDAPNWICAGGATPLGRIGELNPVGHEDSRDIALREMAHAQWTVAEIDSGEPFARFRAEIAMRRVA